MATHKGKLKKKTKGIGWQLIIEGREQPMDIPLRKKFFRDSDATEDMEVEFVSKRPNDPGSLEKVTIPNMPVVEPSTSSKGQGKGRNHGRNSRRDSGHGRQNNDRSKLSPAGRYKAPASYLQQQFHNPYTFLPFYLDHPRHDSATPLTADEFDSKRYTGVLKLKVDTISPLMTCDPNEYKKKKEHRFFRALTIGKDVIVPATGVRGAMRSLLSVLTGCSLSYMNGEARVCQDRDKNLGPDTEFAKQNRRPDVEPLPTNIFLAEIVKPGSYDSPGKIRLGDAQLIKLNDLIRLFGPDSINRSRPSRGNKAFFVRIDENGIPVASNEGEYKEGKAWKVKLSGRPVGSGQQLEGKSEGGFRRNGETIDLPVEFWAAYNSLNCHRVGYELRKGDLVWLQAKDLNAGNIESLDDIESIQWARWGKRGQAIRDLVDEKIWPDYMQDSDEVSVVTDMFGMVNPMKNSQEAFAGRVRPQNLVFEDAKIKKEITLAPLGVPHLGCIASIETIKIPMPSARKIHSKG